MIDRTAELVLVVEDEAYVRELVSYTLQGAGYRVRSVGDGESALREASDTPPDVIVLDIRLPGIDGWEVCQRIREQSNVPILMMTALGEDESHVKGLNLGADDYVKKPFSPTVLAARVQALLRRAAPDASRRVIKLRGLTIDPASGEVRRDDNVVRLTPTEFRVLLALARRVGQVVPARDLLRIAQGHEVSEREAQEVAKVHIRHLRHKLEPQADRPVYILTVRSMGYMLNREQVLKESA